MIILLPENLYVGVKAVASGWGTLTEEGKVSCTLQEVEVPVLSNQECRNTKYSSSMITDNMLCAGYPKTGQKDSCQVRGNLCLNNFEICIDKIEKNN